MKIMEIIIFSGVNVTLIAIIGYFIRESIKDQKEKNKRLSDKDDLLSCAINKLDKTLVKLEQVLLNFTANCEERHVVILKRLNNLEK